MATSLEKLIAEIDVVYDELSFHFNHFDEKHNGQSPAQYCSFNEHKQVEIFIAYLISTKRPLLKEPVFQQTVYSNSEKVTVSPRFRDFFPYGFIFNSQVGLFLINENIAKFDQLIQLLYQKNFGIKASNISWAKEDRSFLTLSNYNFAIELIRGVRAEIGETSSIKKLSQANSALKTKYDKYCEFVENLFELYSSLTFLSMEFALNDQSKVSELHAARKRFFNNGRSVQELTNVVGYIGKWEWSLAKGCYLRVVFIFPTKQVVNAKALCTLISDYWIEDITDGQGICHEGMLAAKTRKLKVKVCNIEHKDTNSVNLFKEHVVRYIAYSEKYFMPIQLAKFLDNEYINFPQLNQVTSRQQTVPHENFSQISNRTSGFIQQPTHNAQQIGLIIEPNKAAPTDSHQQLAHAPITQLHADQASTLIHKSGLQKKRNAHNLTFKGSFKKTIHDQPKEDEDDNNDE